MPQNGRQENISVKSRPWHPMHDITAMTSTQDTSPAMPWRRMHDLLLRMISPPCHHSVTSYAWHHMYDVIRMTSYAWHHTHDIRHTHDVIHLRHIHDSIRMTSFIWHHVHEVMADVVTMTPSKDIVHRSLLAPWKNSTRLGTQSGRVMQAKHSECERILVVHETHSDTGQHGAAWWPQISHTEIRYRGYRL